jgi:hypothetical protein
LQILQGTMTDSAAWLQPYLHPEGSMDPPTTEALHRPPSKTRELARRVGATIALGVLAGWLASIILSVENIHAELALGLLGASATLFGTATVQNVRDAQAQVDVENVRLGHKDDS